MIAVLVAKRGVDIIVKSKPALGNRYDATRRLEISFALVCDRVTI